MLINNFLWKTTTFPKTKTNLFSIFTHLLVSGYFIQSAVILRITRPLENATIQSWENEHKNGKQHLRNIMKIVLISWRLCHKGLKNSYWVHFENHCYIRIILKFYKLQSFCFIYLKIRTFERKLSIKVLLIWF